MLIPFFNLKSKKNNLTDTQNMERKKRINYYFDVASIFCAVVFLNLLGILTISIGCKALNPAFTSSATAAEETTNQMDESTSTNSITENSTTINNSNTSGESATSTTTTTETSTSTSRPTTSGLFEKCGNCEIDPLEDCDICNSQFEIGECTNTCNMKYDVHVLEHDLTLYCENFNYCGEPECGQCEADAVCYITRYKYLVKEGVIDFSKKKLIGVGWVVDEIDPMAPVTLTYEEVPNSFLLQDNAGNEVGYNGEIWLTEKSYYMSGKAIKNISCSVVNK